jgi:hypothetical protein
LELFNIYLMFILLTFECYVMIVFPNPFRPVSDGSTNISFHICHLTLSHNARQHIKEMEIIHPQKHYDDKINILLCFLILWIGTNLKCFPSMISTMDEPQSVLAYTVRTLIVKLNKLNFHELVHMLKNVQK